MGDLKFPLQKDKRLKQFTEILYYIVLNNFFKYDSTSIIRNVLNVLFVAENSIILYSISINSIC